MIEAALLRLNAVAITMPRISPIAQPVRQCRVADTAMFHAWAGRALGLVACLACWVHDLLDPGRGRRRSSPGFVRRPGVARRLPLDRAGTRCRGRV